MAYILQLWPRAAHELRPYTSRWFFESCVSPIVEKWEKFRKSMEKLNRIWEKLFKCSFLHVFVVFGTDNAQINHVFEKTESRVENHLLQHRMYQSRYMSYFYSTKNWIYHFPELSCLRIRWSSREELDIDQRLFPCDSICWVVDLCYLSQESYKLICMS